MTCSIMFKIQLRPYLPLINGALFDGLCKESAFSLGGLSQEDQRVTQPSWTRPASKSCQQNLRNMISPLIDLTFSGVVTSANAPGLCWYVWLQFPKHSFLARISRSFCWNQLSIIQALILGLGVQASLPFPCIPLQSLTENKNPQRVATVCLSMFPKAPRSSCKFAHLLCKTRWSTGGAYFGRPKTKQLQPKIKTKMKKQCFLKPRKYASDLFTTTIQDEKEPTLFEW